MPINGESQIYTKANVRVQDAENQSKNGPANYVVYGCSTHNYPSQIRFQESEVNENPGDDREGGYG